MKKMIMLLVAVLAVSISAKGDAPLEIIKKKDAELQLLLKNKKRPKDQRKKLINSIFNFEEMGKKSLSSSTWKSQSPESQNEFVKNFQEMVENSSVKKLEVYEADSTVYEAPELKNDKAKVTAHMWNKGTESVLVYKMELVNGNWMAWDLIIDDLSTVRNYREQFKKIVNDKGFTELLKILKEKALENAQ